MALGCSSSSPESRELAGDGGTLPPSATHDGGSLPLADAGSASAIMSTRDGATPAARDAGPLASDASAPQGPQDGGNKLLVPLQGALLGHYYGDGTIAATDARLGRKPAVHLTYFGWDEDWTQNEAPAQDFAQGRIPLVNWEPAGVKFEDIVSGKLDSVIQARASGSKKLQKQFFLDFAAEMNGDEGWGGNDPKLYVAAYRRIHDVFVQSGASNVVWVWAPNVTDIPGGAETMEYYPGDAYVDWTGVDGYNWGTSDKDFAWQTFKEVFADIYPKLAAKQKPIMIGEMASDEVGGKKDAWIDAIVPTLKSDYPMIRGFVWFDVDKERKWQVNSSPASLSAYMRMAQDPYLNP